MKKKVKNLLNRNCNCSYLKLQTWLYYTDVNYFSCYKLMWIGVYWNPTFSSWLNTPHRTTLVNVIHVASVKGSFNDYLLLLKILTAPPLGFLQIPRKTEPNSPWPSSAHFSSSLLLIMVCGFSSASFASTGSGGGGLLNIEGLTPGGGGGWRLVNAGCRACSSNLR